MRDERPALSLDEQRQVVTLHRMGAASIYELAQAFGVSYGHVQALIRDDERRRKARRRVRGNL